MNKKIIHFVHKILKESLASDVDKFGLERLVRLTVKDMERMIDSEPNIKESEIKEKLLQALKKYISLPSSMNEQDKDVIESIIELTIEEWKNLQKKTYDLSDEQKTKLVNAYREFDEQFWQVKLLQNQAEILKNLLDVLKDIQKIESEEFIKDVASLTEDAERAYKLSKIKSDTQALYKRLQSTSRELLALKDAATKGLVSADRLKNKFSLKMKEIQRPISELFYDLYSLSEPDAPKINEVEEKKLTRSEKTDVMKKVHATIKKQLSPIVGQLTADSSTAIPFKKMSKIVSQAITDLDKVSSFFPSIQFSSNIYVAYRNAVRELDSVFSDVSNLTSTRDIKTMMSKLQNFSSKIENLFGARSYIKGMKLPEPKSTEKPKKLEPEEIASKIDSIAKNEYEKIKKEQPNIPDEQAKFQSIKKALEQEKITNDEQLSSEMVNDLEELINFPSVASSEDEPAPKRINKKQFRFKLKRIKNQATKMGTSFDQQRATIILRDFLSTQNFKIFESRGIMVRSLRDLEKALIDGKAIQANEHSTKITRLIADMLKEFGVSFEPAIQTKAIDFDTISSKIEPVVKKEIEKVEKTTKQENPKADKKEITDKIKQTIDVEEIADEVIEDIAEDEPPEFIDEIPKEEIIDEVEIWVRNFMMEVDVKELIKNYKEKMKTSRYRYGDYKIVDIFFRADADNEDIAGDSDSVVIGTDREGGASGPRYATSVEDFLQNHEKYFEEY